VENLNTNCGNPAGTEPTSDETTVRIDGAFDPKEYGLTDAQWDFVHGIIQAHKGEPVVGSFPLPAGLPRVRFAPFAKQRPAWVTAAQLMRLLPWNWRAGRSMSIVAVPGKDGMVVLAVL
jgi:hypothetical protein